MLKSETQLHSFDPQLNLYWQERATKQGKVLWAKGSRNYRIAEAQKWQCPLCGEHLFNGDKIETHHIIKMTDGGLDTIDNLIHLHKTCHQHEHTGSINARS
ncbi:MAG: HNH endonuclease [Hydrococcus sp. Prado102]|jgi:RNA-directed DNA polymerase|nr:HNH endonuclease [Hydrococcus sp. Prado102]